MKLSAKPSWWKTNGFIVECNPSSTVQEVKEVIERCNAKYPVYRTKLKYKGILLTNDLCMLSFDITDGCEITIHLRKIKQHQKQVTIANADNFGSATEPSAVMAALPVFATFSTSEASGDYQLSKSMLTVGVGKVLPQPPIPSIIYTSNPLMETTNTTNSKLQEMLPIISSIKALLKTWSSNKIPCNSNRRKKKRPNNDEIIVRGSTRNETQVCNLMQHVRILLKDHDMNTMFCESGGPSMLLSCICKLRTVPKSIMEASLEIMTEICLNHTSFPLLLLEYNVVEPLITCYNQQSSNRNNTTQTLLLRAVCAILANSTTAQESFCRSSKCRHAISDSLNKKNPIKLRMEGLGLLHLLSTSMTASEDCVNQLQEILAFVANKYLTDLSTLEANQVVALIFNHLLECGYPVIQFFPDQKQYISICQRHVTLLQSSNMSDHTSQQKDDISEWVKLSTYIEASILPNLPPAVTMREVDESDHHFGLSHAILQSIMDKSLQLVSQDLFEYSRDCLRQALAEAPSFEDTESTFYKFMNAVSEVDHDDDAGLFVGPNATDRKLYLQHARRLKFMIQRKEWRIYILNYLSGPSSRNVNSAATYSPTQTDQTLTDQNMCDTMSTPITAAQCTTDGDVDDDDCGVFFQSPSSLCDNQSNGSHSDTSSYDGDGDDFFQDAVEYELTVKTRSVCKSKQSTDVPSVDESVYYGKDHIQAATEKEYQERMYDSADSIEVIRKMKDQYARDPSFPTVNHAEDNQTDNDKNSMDVQTQCEESPIEKLGSLYEGRKKRKSKRRLSPTRSTTASIVPSIQKEEVITKQKFLQNKAVVLKALPDIVKDQFGMIGFIAWGKAKSKRKGKKVESKQLPVLIVNPFDLPPGPAQNIWLQKFNQRRNKGTLHSMEKVIFFYGSISHNKAFHICAHNRQIVPVEDGILNNLHTIPSHITQKVLEGVMLSEINAVHYRGIIQMLQDHCDYTKQPCQHLPSIIQFENDSIIFTAPSVALYSAVATPKPKSVKARNPSKSKAEGQTGRKEVPLNLTPEYSKMEQLYMELYLKSSRSSMDPSNYVPPIRNGKGHFCQASRMIALLLTFPKKMADIAYRNIKRFNRAMRSGRCIHLYCKRDTSLSAEHIGNRFIIDPIPNKFPAGLGCVHERDIMILPKSWIVKEKCCDNQCLRAWFKSTDANGKDIFICHRISRKDCMNSKDDLESYVDAIYKAMKDKPKLRRGKKRSDLCEVYMCVGLHFGYSKDKLIKWYAYKKNTPKDRCNLHNEWISKIVTACFNKAFGKVDPSTINAQMSAIKLTGFKKSTMNPVGTHSQFACSTNYCSKPHTDEDGFLGVIGVFDRDKINSREVITHFVFPKAKLAIPLRLGDILLFDPRITHCACNPRNKTAYIYSAYTSAKTFHAHVANWMAKMEILN